MADSVQDLLGNDVVVGDQVAGAFRIGNTAKLRVGTVLGFGTRGSKDTVKVQWHDESSWDGGKAVNTVGAIEVGLKRFVKITQALPSVTGNESLDSVVAF